MKIAENKNSFIQLPHLMIAYSRPEYLRTRVSSIIEISIEPVGLSRPVLRQDQHEEGDEAEQVGGGDVGCDRASNSVVLEIRIVRPRHRGNGEEDEDQSRFGEATDPGRAARAEAAHRARRVERREGDRKARQGQHECAANHIGKEGKRQRLVGDDRDDRRDGQVTGNATKGAARNIQEAFSETALPLRSSLPRSR